MDMPSATNETEELAASTTQRAENEVDSRYVYTHLASCILLPRPGDTRQDFVFGRLCLLRCFFVSL